MWVAHKPSWRHLSGIHMLGLHTLTAFLPLHEVSCHRSPSFDWASPTPSITLLCLKSVRAHVRVRDESTGCWKVEAEWVLGFLSLFHKMQTHPPQVTYKCPSTQWGSPRLCHQKKWQRKKRAIPWNLAKWLIIRWQGQNIRTEEHLHTPPHPAVLTEAQ